MGIAKHVNNKPKPNVPEIPDSSDEATNVSEIPNSSIPEVVYTETELTLIDAEAGNNIDPSNDGPTDSQWFPLSMFRDAIVDTKINGGAEGLVVVLVPIERYNPAHYSTSHLEVRLTPEQRAALNALRNSLSFRNARWKALGAKHPDGKVVDSDGDAIRWLLDQVHAGLVRYQGNA